MFIDSISHWLGDLTGYNKISSLLDSEKSANAILSSANRNMTAKIKAQNDLIFQLQKSDDGKAAKIVELYAQVNSLNTTATAQQQAIADRDVSINSLKTQLAQTGEPQVSEPAFLDQTRTSYQPYLQFFTPDGKMSGCTMDDPRDIYSICPTSKFLVVSNGWNALPKYARLMKFWEFAVKLLSYTPDDGDNWQSFAQSYYRKRGDCEDDTTIQVDLCWVGGIRADEAFGATGSIPQGKHAFFIANLSAEDIRGTLVESDGPGWYVYEGTLDFMPDRPRKLIGSPYRIEDGLANWKFQGTVIPSHYAEFGIAPAAPGARVGRQRILNTHEKRRLLSEDWHAWQGKKRGTNG